MAHLIFRNDDSKSSLSFLNCPIHRGNDDFLFYDPKKDIIDFQNSVYMAQILPLYSLRLGDTFVLLPDDAKTILGEGVTIYNFTPPHDFYIFKSYQRWTRSCRVYSSTSACSPCDFPKDTLVIKF